MASHTWLRYISFLCVGKGICCWSQCICCVGTSCRSSRDCWGGNQRRGQEGREWGGVWWGHGIWTVWLKENVLYREFKIDCYFGLVSWNVPCLPFPLLNFLAPTTASLLTTFIPLLYSWAKAFMTSPCPARACFRAEIRSVLKHSWGNLQSCSANVMASLMDWCLGTTLLARPTE